MNKIIIFFMSLLCLQLADAATGDFDEISIIGRIEGKGEAMRVIRSLEGDSLSGMLESNDLEKEFSQLQKNDDVLIRGYVTYQSFSLEGGAPKPVLVVKSIKPVSFSRLSRSEKYEIPELNFKPNTETFSPFTIPVSTEVASAITLTSTMLLLQSLTSTPNDIKTNQQINSGLILFAGMVATGVYIYEQITESNKGSTK